MPEFETISAPATDVEDTGAQLLADITVDAKTGIATKKQSKGNWFKRVRLVRSHPTVKLGRLLSISPALAAGWSVETGKAATGAEAPPEARDLVARVMLPMRNHLLKQALLNCVDFGFSPFEVIWTITPEGYIVPKRFKPLLVDVTKIVVATDTGKYAGLYQEVKDIKGNTKKLTLDVAKTLLINQNVEGTNWYGRGDMEDVEPFYTRWETTDTLYTNYEAKYSGAQWVITYPVGSSRVGGVEKNNSTIAREMLGALRANAGITIPRTLKGPNGTGDLTANKIVTDNDWTIELIEGSSTASTAFDTRFKSLDVLLLRALVQPERALIEGKYGTKAESEAHSDVAFTYAEDRHFSVLQAINKHIVNKMLIFNFGEEYQDSVKLINEPVGASEKLFLRDVYKAILTSQQGYALESTSIDTESIKNLLGVPVLEDDRMSVLREEFDKGAEDDTDA